LIQAPQGGYGALLDQASIVSVRLDELDVAAWTGGGDLDKHVATAPPDIQNKKCVHLNMNVPPQENSKKEPKMLIHMAGAVAF
jgi:hypothetical protein